MIVNFKSPAKINLFLKIMGRRSDGFHELASLFQAIDLFDELQFKLTDQDVLTCTDSRIPLDHHNLVIKALKLFRLKTNYHQPLHIHLTKNIPVEAGLGGGSSNAATTLWALNELSGRKASLDQLINWGKELGSDVPFFFSSGLAYCTGRGEVFQNMPPLSYLKHISLYKPSEGASTAEVYKNLCMNQLAKRDVDRDVKRFCHHDPIYYNDLEPSTFSIYPKLLEFKNTLCALGLKNVTMSGSGSAFFSIDDKPSTIKLEKYWSCLVKSVYRSQERWY